MSSLSIEAICFYGFAGMALLSAIFILFSDNLIYAAFALFLSFLGIAALYVLAGADFLAVTQIMVYVGGILVLLIFGIMLTQKRKSVSSSSPNKVTFITGRALWGAFISLSTFGALAYICLTSNFVLTGPAQPRYSTVRTIGVALMTSHLLPFEIAAILLLVALIGAAYLALHRNPVR
jgi:NADH:ubiquinone oxidoreductase subunit 6 (subunit J)